jgi:dolichol-phosphate mannosyltransferase
VTRKTTAKKAAPKPASADSASPVSGEPVYELTVVVPTFNERGNVRRLLELVGAALEGVHWQVIFVDDDSPDGTAQLVKEIAADDPRIQCIRRVGRRGLAGAVIEGALASAAPFVAVIDGDLQHDETLLPKMLKRLEANEADLVVASRYVEGGGETGGFTKTRAAGSRFANWLGVKILRAHVTDPVSGFFMVRRSVVEEAAPRLSTDGFKILFDIIATTHQPLRIFELPYQFRERAEGASKLDNRVVIQYLGLLITKATNDLISPRFIMFGLVGASGFVVQYGVTKLLGIFAPHFGGEAVTIFGLAFLLRDALGALIAMTSNFVLNNFLTYADRRKKGFALITGYLQFCLACSAGLVVNLGVGALVRHFLAQSDLLATASGVGAGAVWNYVSTAFAVW